jgi:hypothetical protein
MAARNGDDAQFVEAFVVEPGVGDVLGIAGDRGEVGEFLAGGFGEFSGTAGGEVADGEVALLDEAEVSPIKGRRAEDRDGRVSEDRLRRGGKQRRGENDVTDHATRVARTEIASGNGRRGRRSECW